VSRARGGSGERPRNLAEIAARRRELARRAAEQREALAAATAGLAPAFAAGDRVAGVGRSLLAHPLLLAAAGGLVLAMWPRAVLGAATRAFALLSGVRGARRLLGMH
jgi:hypothetical protein